MGKGGKVGRAVEGGRGAPPSRNPGYANEMRPTYGKMTYTYCTCVIGKNNVRTVRTVAP